MGGFDYMQYIAPGLIMMAVITNSYGNVVSSFFGAKFGSAHRGDAGLAAAELGHRLGLRRRRHAARADGRRGGDRRCRCCSRTCRCITSFAILAAVLLTSAMFSLGGFINAVFAKNFDQVNWIPTFILTPLTYFGGVFYSISLLPEWAQKISVANPILHMVNAFRYGFLGTSDVNVGGAFAIMLACVIGMFTWAVILLNRGSGIRD